MKKMITVTLLLVALSYSAYAVHWEMGIVADSGKVIKIYRNGIYVHYDTIGVHGWAQACGSYTAGYFLSVGDNEVSAYGQPLEASAIYRIIIDGRVVDLTTAPPPPDISGDFTIFFDGTNFSIQSCNPGKWSIGSTYDWSTWGIIDIQVKNSFDSGTLTVDSTSYQSGYVFAWGTGTNHTITASDNQNYDGYVRRFDYWSELGSGNNLSLSVSPTASGTYKANFKKQFDIVFQNNASSGSIGGVINVNQSQCSSPTDTFHVTQSNTIRGTATSPQTINGIIYIFTNWYGGNGSADSTFTPNDHRTYTAVFSIVKPVEVTGVFIPSNWGEPIQVTWEKHPNSDVVYKIYRRVSGNVEFLATVNHNDTSCTDDVYTCGGYTNLFYDVRAYHTPSQTYADENWNITAGTINPAKGGGDDKPFLSPQKVTHYSVSSYPNPFNPATTLSYQLVEDANVRLEIYDMMGREIVSLVDGQSNAGYHSVVWNGNGTTSSAVASGLYVYRFIARPLSGEKSYVKTGKLLLMK